MNMPRRLMLPVVLGATTLAATIVTSALAETADEVAVAEAVEFFRKAMLSKVRPDLSRLCAEQMSYGHSSGKVQTKDQFLADTAAGKTTWKELKFSDVKNSVAGDGAISRFTLTGQTEADNKSTPVNIGVLMVWQKQEGAWKLLARQGFKVA